MVLKMSISEKTMLRNTIRNHGFPLVIRQLARLKISNIVWWIETYLSGIIIILPLLLVNSRIWFFFLTYQHISLIYYKIKWANIYTLILSTVIVDTSYPFLWSEKMQKFFHQFIFITVHITSFPLGVELTRNAGNICPLKNWKHLIYKLWNTSFLQMLLTSSCITVQRKCPFLNLFYY